MSLSTLGCRRPSHLRCALGVLGFCFLAYFAIQHNFLPLSSRGQLPRDILSVEGNSQSGLQVEDQGKEEEERLKLPEDEDKQLLAGISTDDLNRGITEKEAEEARKTVSYLVDDVREKEVTVSKTMKLNPNELCPEVEDLKDLQGPLPQAVLLIQNLKEAEVRAAHPYLRPGGEWSPSECLARYKVAVIIPFRDRQTHLTRLLDFLIPILKRQRLDFRFIVTEQFGEDLFNKGRIMNAAFRLAERLHVDCVVFHDVDMFPQDDRNPYSCPPSPRHIGAFVSNLGYQLWYKEIVGGVLAISMEDYRTVNGYSNMYWAWGGEDDDMGKRILSLNYTIERPNPETGKFSMLKHVKRKRTAPKLIYQLLETADKRWETDGLNQTDIWKVVKLTVRPLYYHLYVDVGVPPNEWRAEPAA